MSERISINQLEQILTLTNTTKHSNFDSSLLTIDYLLESDCNHKVIIAFVSKLLKKNCEEAYVLLNKIISCVSKDVLYENASLWMRTITDNSCQNEVHGQRYTAISNLIQLSCNNQDFNKLMVSSCLFKIINECLEIKKSQVGDSLECLAVCLDQYSQTSGPIKNKIETYLLQFISLKMQQLALVKKASLCFLKLQKVGNAGTNNSNHKNNWKNSFEKLSVTLDKEYDSFLEDIEEFYENSDGKSTVVPYTLPDLPKEVGATEMVYLIESRLENICIFLRGLLEGQFNLPKYIYAQNILDIIARPLSLHICIDNNNTDSKFHLSILLVKHQISVLYLLRSLIAVSELNLLPFSSVITKLLVDCLTRSSKCKCFNHLSNYKKALYKVLEYWILTIRNCVNSNFDKVVNLIINDISPVTTDVSLNISNVNSNMSGKMKKRNIEAKIISSSIIDSNTSSHTKIFLKNKEDICYQALCCLSSLLQNISLSIKDSTKQKLYDVITEAIATILNENPATPYNNSKIQMKLFETLLATIEYAKPPSIGLIINLFQRGRHKNTRISQICIRGLTLLEKICQPSCPSLNDIAVDQHDSEKYFNEERMPPLLELSEVTDDTDFESAKEIPMQMDVVVEVTKVQCGNTIMETEDAGNGIRGSNQLLKKAEVKSDMEFSQHKICTDVFQLNEDKITDNNKLPLQEEIDRDSELYQYEMCFDIPQSNKSKITGNDEFAKQEVKRNSELSEPDINDMLWSFVDEMPDDEV